jgi:hypothetical protein
LAALWLTAEYFPGWAVALRRAVALRDNRLRLRLGNHLANNRKLFGRAVALRRAVALDLGRSIEITRDLRAVTFELAEALNLNHSS